MVLSLVHFVHYDVVAGATVAETVASVVVKRSK